MIDISSETNSTARICVSLDPPTSALYWKIGSLATIYFAPNSPTPALRFKSNRLTPIFCFALNLPALALCYKIDPLAGLFYFAPNPPTPTL